MLPKRIHTYQSHSLDSTRWDRFQPRDDDIIIATAPRSGTTWTQAIVRELLFYGQDLPELNALPLDQVSMWLDAPWGPLDEVINDLEAQKHRRFTKTHLALDGLPFFPQVKYLVVTRDARDVAMSVWNFYANFTEAFLEEMNNRPGRVGEPMPPCPPDIHEFWRTWISRGWFEWEDEGYPFLGNLHHTQSWWEYRHLENIYFVHYNDLLSDRVGEIGRIASFLGITLDDEALAAVAQATGLDALRERETKVSPDGFSIWKDGAKSFFYKGTNQRWREILSNEELALYEETAAKVVTPDCRAWLEQGRSAWPSPTAENSSQYI